MTLSMKAANSIASERSNQTMEVLLTTPLAGSDIVRQKMQGQRRLMLVFMIPFVTAFLIEAWWEGTLPRYLGRNQVDVILFMLSSLLSIFIYLPMFSWFSMWVGLKVRGKRRAIVLTLTIITAWVGAPFLVVIFAHALGGYYRSGLDMFLLFSPISVIIATEFGSFSIFGLSPGVAVLLNYLLHGGILFYFRWLCLRKADRYLGRQ
jgi:ABC-type Na+ efflux pump permease subunit